MKMMKRELKFWLLIIAAMAIIILSGCKKQINQYSFNGFTYTISEGHHYANGIFTKIGNKAVLPFDRDVLLNDGCWYEKDAIEHSGYNKVIGVTGVNIHGKSCRIVWQPSFDSIFVVRLYSYVYPDKDEHWKDKYLTSVRTNEWFNVHIDYYNDWWVITVTTKDGVFTNYITGNKPVLLFKTYPYFGGRSTAPHDMKIKIK